MSEKKERFYIRTWMEVTEEEYVAAERAAGFHNTLGEPDKPATSAFSGKGIEGKQGFLMKDSEYSAVVLPGHNI